MGRKWLATQGEHAEQWAQLLSNAEGVTVETRIPQSVADQLYFERRKLDGIGPANTQAVSSSTSSTGRWTASGCGHDQTHC
jgi:hypothetical protein